MHGWVAPRHPSLTLTLTPTLTLTLTLTPLCCAQIPVVVGNCTGFAVNRVFFPYTMAAIMLVDGGMDPYAIDKVRRFVPVLTAAALGFGHWSSGGGVWPRCTVGLGLGLGSPQIFPVFLFLVT